MIIYNVLMKKLACAPTHPFHKKSFSSITPFHLFIDLPFEVLHHHFTTFELDSDCLSSFFIKFIFFWNPWGGAQANFYTRVVQGYDEFW